MALKSFLCFTVFLALSIHNINAACPEECPRGYSCFEGIVHMDSDCTDKCCIHICTSHDPEGNGKCQPPYSYCPAEQPVDPAGPYDYYYSYDPYFEEEKGGTGVFVCVKPEWQTPRHGAIWSDQDKFGNVGENNMQACYALPKLSESVGSVKNVAVCKNACMNQQSCNAFNFKLRTTSKIKELYQRVNQDGLSVGITKSEPPSDCPDGECFCEFFFCHKPSNRAQSSFVPVVKKSGWQAYIKRGCDPCPANDVKSCFDGEYHCTEHMCTSSNDCSGAYSYCPQINEKVYDVLGLSISSTREERDKAAEQYNKHLIPQQEKCNEIFSGPQKELCERGHLYGIRTAYFREDGTLDPEESDSSLQDFVAYCMPQPTFEGRWIQTEPKECGNKDINNGAGIPGVVKCSAKCINKDSCSCNIATMPTFRKCEIKTTPSTTQMTTTIPKKTQNAPAAKTDAKTLKNLPATTIGKTIQNVPATMSKTNQNVLVTDAKTNTPLSQQTRKNAPSSNAQSSVRPNKKADVSVSMTTPISKSPEISQDSDRQNMQDMNSAPNSSDGAIVAIVVVVVVLVFGIIAAIVVVVLRRKVSIREKHYRAKVVVDTSVSETGQGVEL